MKLATPIVTVMLSFALGATAYAFDERGAEKLAKRSKCFTCHAIDKEKDGPSLQEISKKYKGKADTEDKLYTHLTTNPMVEVDGAKEEHKSPRSDDEADIRNLIQWILSH